MSNLLDIINKFNKLTFQFKANVEYPFASKSSKKSTIELIEWDCEYINQLSPQDFISQLSQLEKVPKIIRDRIEDNLHENDLMMLRKATERLSTILTNYEFIVNHDYKYLSNPSASDFKFHLTTKGEEGLHYFQVTFNEVEMQDSRRSNSLDDFAKDYITSILHLVRERFLVLKEELAVMLAPLNTTSIPSIVTSELRKYQAQRDSSFEKMQNRTSGLKDKTKDRFVGEFNFCSEYFSDRNIDVVDTLRNELILQLMIGKCTHSTFRQIFALIQRSKPVSKKINWKGQKGAFRYFINHMVDQLDVTNRDLKFRIANNCFTYKDSENDFTTLGNNGKDPNSQIKAEINKIIAKAKILQRNSGETKK